MIVSCGDLAGHGPRAISAAAVAVRAAARGAAVQVVGIVPDDPDGDRRLLDLAEAGVGHAAVLRGPARALEAADLDLALRYLPEVRVVVLVEPVAAVLDVAAGRAEWSGAALLVVGGPEGPALPDSAIVLQPPRSDPDGTFAGFVGALAVHLDGGETPADAWAATTRELAVDPA
ncbi:MAG: hypothetical protein AB1736_14595 [Chloroflexota bacterium]